MGPLGESEILLAGRLALLTLVRLLSLQHEEQSLLRLPSQDQMKKHSFVGSYPRLRRAEVRTNPESWASQNFERDRQAYSGTLNVKSSK